MAGKIAAAAALVLLLSAPSAFGEAAKRKSLHRLDEVRIVGSAEHPGVLFFLPRARFRLLPVRERQGGKGEILRDDSLKGGFPD